MPEEHWYARGTIATVDSTLVCQKHSCNCVFNTGMSEAQLQLCVQYWYVGGTPAISDLT